MYINIGSMMIIVRHFPSKNRLQYPYSVCFQPRRFSPRVTTSVDGLIIQQSKLAAENIKHLGVDIPPRTLPLMQN